MSHYKWQGVNAEGVPQSGELSASSSQAAKQCLRQQGIVVRSLHKKVNILMQRAPTAQDLNLCFRQWATGLQQGIPILHLLKAMETYQHHRSLKQAFQQIHHALAQGGALFEALKQHPTCFPVLACHWIQMGEQFGTLPEVLHHIADYYATQAQFKQRLRKALTYPVTILVLAGLVVTGIMIMVVPQFAAFYQYFSADMPWATRYLIQISKRLQQGWFILPGLFIIGMLMLRQPRKIRSKYLEKWLLSLPFLGHLLKLVTLARIMTTLRTTYASGLSLVDGFQAAEQVAGYRIYQDKMLFMLQLLRQGEPLRVILQRGQFFPLLVIQLLGLGEETGTLSTSFAQISTYYEQEIERCIYTITTIFEPLLMALLGIGIGGLMIALYLPILNLGNIL